MSSESGCRAAVNVPAMTFIARAYSAVPVDMVGLPEWARTERYDLNTTASLVKPTPEQRAAMMRAMLERQALRLQSSRLSRSSLA